VCPPFYVYLAGGVCYDATHLYSVSLPPQLQHIVNDPPFFVSYASHVTWTGALYSGIEMLVYAGPIATGIKVAYGNQQTFGSQGSISMSIPSMGCFDNGGGPWNFDCSGL
jgi:hypothetical protein